MRLRPGGASGGPASGGQPRAWARRGRSGAPSRPPRSPAPYGQAKRCLESIADALAEVGAAPSHVVRTRVYLVDPADWEAVGRAHGEVFGDVLPASAMLVIAGLLDPAWRVEIEADALLPE